MTDLVALLSAGAAAGALYGCYSLARWLGLTEPEELKRFFSEG
ncbi:MAG TPA: hypothetical protein VF699_02315 [Caulobacteraceae bacterium]|jgi:hypothetical protein